MFQFLKHLLATQNQFASGGLFLMAIGSVGVFLRSLPQRAWWWIVQQTTMTITVKDDDDAFVWVKEWLLEQSFLKRLRRVDLDTTLRGADMALIPAPGRHLFWHQGRPFWVWFYRSEDTSGRSMRRTESLTFRTVGRRQAFLKNFASEIVACHRRKARTSSYLYVYDDCWTYVSAYSPRLLDSVVMKPGEKEHVLQDLAQFRNSRPRYRRLGVPYHRGYLLYGPPGTGKTSLVSALAAKFGMSIYMVNLTEFNDRSLKMAMNDVPENSVILFEDIDCMKAGERRAGMGGANEQDRRDDRDKTPPLTGVTLSGLLNVLDGFHAPENVVYMMTTNSVESLDPALLRPGRIDYRLYMGEASSQQRVELYRRFFPEASEHDARIFAEAHCAQTMAEFQGLLLSLEQDADHAVAEGKEVTASSARELETAVASH
ncbi:chaperone BCS1 [Bryocella elongata]|uniref:Chaperone BCS1 n=1 Tax=Bryocella elongata TaxID=863522 RepID=A0A1H6BPE1_9BACT|nr:AAA family ATPase [Bryocella elongata]SEG62550.1 chaperone BCS1 [Bryocella elongata]